jgi:hypothetical protein
VHITQDIVYPSAQVVLRCTTEEMSMLLRAAKSLWAAALLTLRLGGVPSSQTIE